MKYKHMRTGHSNKTKTKMQPMKNVSECQDQWHLPKRGSLELNMEQRIFLYTETLACAILFNLCRIQTNKTLHPASSSQLQYVCKYLGTVLM